MGLPHGRARIAALLHPSLDFFVYPSPPKASNLSEEETNHPPRNQTASDEQTKGGREADGALSVFRRVGAGSGAGEAAGGGGAARVAGRPRQSR